MLRIIVTKKMVPVVEGKLDSEKPILDSNFLYELNKPVLKIKKTNSQSTNRVPKYT